MKILLVAINAKYIHSNPAVFSLKACAGEYGPLVDIVEFTINQQPAYILQEIYKKAPDVIAFSCYIWNYRLIDSIIFDLHKVLPDADIWAGGPEITYDAEETIRKWQLRGVMTGPGESVFRRLAAAYAANASEELPEVLDGNREHRLSLDEIPFWYEAVKEQEHRIIYYESSRGCPFSCSYCLSSIDKTMDFRSVERVCRELDFFLEKKVPQVKFVDRTFNCRKEHALPILKHILEHDNGVTNFHFEMAADLLDEDYLTVLESMRPGAVQLEIGVQSTNERTIREISRKMDFGKAAAAVTRILKKDNIHVHLDLIAGLPYEDMDSFKRSFNDVYALYPHQLQLGFLKVLKGSAIELHAQEYGLQYSALPPYEVLFTKWLSYEAVCHLKQIEEVLEIYHNSGQFRRSLQYLCGYFETPFDMYEYIAAWYEKHGLFGIRSSRVQKYETLLECGISRIASDTENDPSCRRVRQDPSIERMIAMYREYLTFDLYLREPNMKSRPAFCPSLDRWKERIHDMIYEESKTHAIFPALSGHSYRELMKALHVEVFEYIFGHPAACVFYSEKGKKECWREVNIS